jgi:putative IMPACT (imprinted ancient) family translation regulator
VRYFGGVKLGVSGLTNAYKLAALSALENAVVVEITLTKSFSINYDYPETSIIKKLVNEFNLKIRNEKFNEVCLLEFDVKLSLAENLVTKIDRLALQGHKIRIH